ncbi:MAG TPA: hypothetical protein VHU87_13830 [Rhizomicrobium sp.]|jgi:hypothetical protein|nr:hypothetical protein [Rhizomicrobium sp.]
MAQFDNYTDSADSFAVTQGGIVQGISDPSQFAAALQNAREYGINPDGTPVKSFVSQTARTIGGVAAALDCLG